MTTQQEHLIRQAIGALKAALGAAPELPFVEPVAESVDLTGLQQKTRVLAANLYAMHGTKVIDWHDRKLRRLILESGFNNPDNFLWGLERRGIVRVNRSDNGRRLIVSIEFLKPVTA